MKISEEKVLKKQQDLNEKLASVLKKNRITNFRMTSLGNSIASGYSMNSYTKPLLLRNESIGEIMKENGVALDIHHFARAQNNNDEHVFNWLTTNIEESEICKMNRKDYEEGSKIRMATTGLDDKTLREYYPTNKTCKLQDTILESDGNLLNAVIYNGCTGSFLDNITRNGKLSECLTYGIKRDTTSLEATLKYIQSQNRKKGSNTQIYLCGAPNFLGLHITDIINNKLKKIAEQYANTTYVEPVKSKLFYETGVDIHYDELEYLMFNNNIIEAIIENYEVNQAMINVDRKLSVFSGLLEFNMQSYIKSDTFIENHTQSMIGFESEKLDTLEKREKFYKKMRTYLIERTPYDFHYLGKKHIKNSIDNTEKSLKRIKERPL